MVKNLQVRDACDACDANSVTFSTKSWQKKVMENASLPSRPSRGAGKTAAFRLFGGIYAHNY